MTITIPAASLASNANLAVLTNTDAKFTIGAAPSATVGDLDVAGTSGSPLAAAVNLVITISNTTFTGLTNAANVASWITNLPTGLTAVVAAGHTSTSVTIEINGTPTQTRSAAMTITIPAASLASNANLAVLTNTDAKFTIGAAAPSATVGELDVVGTLNQVVAPVELVITLLNDTFKVIAQNATLTWITNLPAGLTAKAKEAVADGDLTVTIVIEGTPTQTRSAPMTIEIPSAVLNTSSSDLAVLTNEDAKFTIS
jgi:hypothetical protein